MGDAGEAEAAGAGEERVDEKASARACGGAGMWRRGGLGLGGSILHGLRRPTFCMQMHC